MKWKYNSKSKKSNYSSIAGKKQFFELTFDVKHKEMVMDAYLPYVIETFKAMKDAEKIVKLHTLPRSDTYTMMRWSAINLEHPAAFETIAMDTKQKRLLLEDLDRFVKRKEFNQRVGRAWKRGYLLYGPPGTGKSSLIAAIANYLKFDIYDLQLTHLTSDVELRRVLLATTNKSILVNEDIDCSQLKLQDKSNSSKKNDSESYQLSLSGLLNFTDGLWSGCGEERIIVFTTNHKSKLDPALLRSGRMDMHFHMSYCSHEGFKTLASTYLGIKEHQPLFDEIKSLLQKTDVTPAQVAEELMKSEDANVALQALITRLKEIKKKKEDDKKAKDEAKVKNDTKKVDPKQLTYFI
ncbi:hypothetical protein ACLB2K_023535 [Fragaria x ananassa]